MADTASFSAAMKTKFIGPIRDTMRQGKILLWGDPNASEGDFKGILARAENIDFVGNEFRIPFKTRRNQATGFRAEGEDLPAASAGAYTYLSEPMRYQYGAFNITGQLLKASKTNEGAFKEAFKSEMEDTVLSAKIDLCRAAYGDGSGKMADVRTAAAVGATSVDVSSTLHFYGGEIIDFVAANGTVISPAAVVTSFDRTARTITLSAGLLSALTAGTHFIVRSSPTSTIAKPNNSQNREIQGLASIVSDTGVLHTVNPAAVPHWRSYKKAINGAISDAVLRDAVDGVGFETGGSTNDNLLISTRGVRRRYADTLLSVKRFTNAESTTLRGGFKALMFDEHYFVVDDQCPLGELFGISPDALFWAQMSDWEWMEEDGKVLKKVPNKDQYEAVLFKYSQLGTTARNKHFRLTGLNDDVK